MTPDRAVQAHPDDQADEHDDTVISWLVVVLCLLAIVAGLAYARYVALSGRAW